jgi:hypothetical protein
MLPGSTAMERPAAFVEDVRLFARTIGHGWPRDRAHADIVRLCLTHGPGQTDIIRRCGAVRLLANNDETLFGPQNVHGLGAIGGKAMGLTRRPDRFPDLAAMLGGHIDFKTEFARETDAEQPCRHAANLALGEAHMGQGLW